MGFESLFDYCWHASTVLPWTSAHGEPDLSSVQRKGVDNYSPQATASTVPPSINVKPPKTLWKVQNIAKTQVTATPSPHRTEQVSLIRVPHRVLPYPLNKPLPSSSIFSHNHWLVCLFSVTYKGKQPLSKGWYTARRKQFYKTVSEKD